MFGSLCYASTLQNLRTKLSCRERKSLFLGYQLGFKGFVLLDLNTNETFISKNVTLHEHILPYHTSSSDSSQNWEYFNANSPSTPNPDHIPSHSDDNILFSSPIAQPISHIYENSPYTDTTPNLITLLPILLSEFLFEHDTHYPICKIMFLPPFMMILTNHPQVRHIIYLISYLIIISLHPIVITFFPLPHTLNLKYIMRLINLNVGEKL